MQTIVDTIIVAVTISTNPHTIILPKVIIALINFLHDFFTNIRI